MEIAIGNSTYFLDRILFGMVMQIAWTLMFSIAGILTCKKRDILLLSAISAVPLPALLLLTGDFGGALIFLVAAAIGSGIALQNRRSVGAAFAVTTMGSISILMVGWAIFGARTSQWGLCAVCMLASVISPLLAAEDNFRRRINGELPRSANSYRPEYDDGGCYSGDCGSGFGRAGSGF